MSNKTQRVLIAILTVAIAVAVVVLVVRMSSTPVARTSMAEVVADPTPSPDLSLDGVWKSGDFVAVVKDNTISLRRGKHQLWFGDFPSKIISANMSSTGIMSNAPDQSTRQFIYEDGKISFVDNKTVIYLQK